MLFSNRIAAALLALGPLVSATLLTRGLKEICDSKPGVDILALHEELAKDNSQLARRDSGELISLDARVHVIAANATKQGGWITQEAIDEQIKILNNAFASSNLTFKLVGIDWTTNISWANQPERYKKDLKSKLHGGDSRTLNLYYAPGLGDGGVCEFPNMNAYEGEALAMDGCMSGSFTLPGSEPPYNMGMTTVHEVGHWFGLLHTFQGGCDERRGDFIADTPAEAIPNEGCQASRDTCIDLPGLDPNDNYMDYSSDSCRNRFTSGQTARMRSILSLIRLGKLEKREIDNKNDM